MKDKEFDAVRVMGEIWDELSRRYNEYPSAMRKELQEIRKKYEIKGCEWERVLLMMGCYVKCQSPHFVKTKRQ